MQRTLNTELRFEGTGLHSGALVRMVIRPAAADTGIVFVRTDQNNALIAARWDRVTPSRLCTQLSNETGVTVSTVEHVMAALAGCGVHNALVSVDGPELPILDGSAAPYVAAILDAGLAETPEPLKAWVIEQPVIVREGDAWAKLEPHDGFRMSFRIDFADTIIGQQQISLDMANGAFVRELCDSRTFCRFSDVEAMRAQGLALGGTLSNALVADGDDYLTPGGPRRADEPVRHKMLDAIGDLALAGAPLVGKFSAHKGGHAMTNKLLRAAFARKGALALRKLADEQTRKLPGIGISHADMPAVA